MSAIGFSAMPGWEDWPLDQCSRRAYCTSLVVAIVLAPRSCMETVISPKLVLSCLPASLDYHQNLVPFPFDQLYTVVKFRIVPLDPHGTWSGIGNLSSDFNTIFSLFSCFSSLVLSPTSVVVPADACSVARVAAYWSQAAKSTR